MDINEVKSYNTLSIVVSQPSNTAERRSERQRRPAISNDYVVYSLKSMENDSISSKQTTYCEKKIQKWFDAMKKS